MADQLTFSLYERPDRNGQKYLCGSIRLYNVIVFIFPSDSGVPGEYKGVVKPYQQQRESPNSDEFEFET